MKIPLYQIDAFTNQLFGGNPAAVCPLDNWLSDDLLQKIAMENNLAETAFFVKTENGFHIRWFTPKAEVDLCGHATLATAYVMFKFLGYKDKIISFHSRSGLLNVSNNEGWLTLDFPVDKIEKIESSADLNACFDKSPVEIYKGIMDYLFIYPDQKTIETLTPYLERISEFGSRGIIVTAKGNEVDFVSRYFAPGVGISEDPVTGSAHTTLTSYWHKHMRKNEFVALQLSERGGYLKCALKGDRVEISGQAKPYLIGEIEVE